MEELEEKVKIVEIVTIAKLVPVFKDTEEANAIQVCNFNFENGDECGYNVIAGKGLYEIGSKAIYIQPDYCLSDIKLFESFVAPNGDPKKTRLGKMNRIRALKFNFSFDGSTDPIYSFGVLLPLSEVEEYLGRTITEDMDLTEILGITKYEEPEKSGSGLTAGDFPSFMYKTDENNIMNIVGKVRRAIEQKQSFGVCLKHDGSSFTEAFKIVNTEYENIICSRSQQKKNEQKMITDYIDNDGNKYHKFINPDTKEKGWFNDNLHDFRLDGQMSEMKPIIIEVKDSWVDLAHSSGLDSKGLEYCKKHGLELAFRGEIYGQGLKGSGNKLNPDSNQKQTLRLFGIDDLSEGFAKRINYSSEHNLKNVCTELGLEYTDPTIIEPSSYEELIEMCQKIFKSEAEQGRIIEGVVIRTMYTNDISCKYMNEYYDSKK